MGPSSAQNSTVTWFLQGGMEEGAIASVLMSWKPPRGTEPPQNTEYESTYRNFKQRPNSSVYVRVWVCVHTPGFPSYTPGTLSKGPTMSLSRGCAGDRESTERAHLETGFWPQELYLWRLSGEATYIAPITVSERKHKLLASWKGQHVHHRETKCPLCPAHRPTACISRHHI